MSTQETEKKLEVKDKDRQAAMMGFGVGIFLCGLSMAFALGGLAVDSTVPLAVGLSLSSYTAYLLGKKAKA